MLSLLSDEAFRQAEEELDLLDLSSSPPGSTVQQG